MNNKTHLLSFLMMDIYANSVLTGSPSQVVNSRVEEALNFVDFVDKAMRRRGWLDSETPESPATPSTAHQTPYPGLREFVKSEVQTTDAA